MKKFVLSLVAVCLLCSSTVMASEKSFTDVTEGDWYYTTVMGLADKGYINGYEDGTFGPSKTITAGEFFTILMNVFMAEYETGGEYWYSGVETYYNTEVKDSSVPDVDMSVPLTRGDLAIQLAALSYGMPVVNEGIVLNDVEKDGSALSEAIYELAEIGYMVGDEEGNFNADNVITRAEATVVLTKYSDFMYSILNAIEGMMTESGIEVDINSTETVTEDTETVSEYSSLLAELEGNPEYSSIHSDDVSGYVDMRELVLNQSATLVDGVYTYTGILPVLEDGYTWNVILKGESVGEKYVALTHFYECIKISDIENYESDYAVVTYAEGNYEINYSVNGVTEENSPRLSMYFFVTDVNGESDYMGIVNNCIIEYRYYSGSELSYNDWKRAKYSSDLLYTFSSGQDIEGHECFPYYIEWYGSK